MALCHFATLDIPMKIGEPEVYEHMMSFVSYCLLKGYLKEEDLPRLHLFGGAIDKSHTVINVYLETTPGENSTETSDAPAKKRREPAEPPFGDKPTPFDPKALKDIPAGDPGGKRWRR